MKSRNAEVHDRIFENTPIFQAARRSDIAMQIRSKMVEKGLKSVDLAERLGVSEANISRWLRGNQNLRLDTLYQLAEAIEERLRVTIGFEEVATAIQSTEPHCQKLINDIASKQDIIVNRDFISERDNVFHLADYTKMRTQTQAKGGSTFAPARSESGVSSPECDFRLAN